MRQLTQSLSTLTMVTMTSREIADLVEKRHDNVKRTIETLMGDGKLRMGKNLPMESLKSST
jgi:phage regulator Rha-like protein